MNRDIREILVCVDLLASSIQFRLVNMKVLKAEFQFILLLNYSQILRLWLSPIVNY